MRLSEPLHFVAIPCDSNRWRLKSLKKNKYNLATSFYFKYFYFLKQDKISKVLYRNEGRVCSTIMCCVGIFTLADISEDHDPGAGGWEQSILPGGRRSHETTRKIGHQEAAGVQEVLQRHQHLRLRWHRVTHRSGHVWFYLRNCFLNSDNKQRNHNTQWPLVNSWWMINDKYPSLVFDFFALHHRQQETFILVCFTSIS